MTPMSDEHMSEIPDKDYEATFNILMPGNVKVTTYKIAVKACDPIVGMAKALDAWKEATEPSDVQIKEIKATRKVN